MKPAVKARKASIEALLEAIAAQIAALPLESIRELLPALQAAERELAARLSAWLATAPDANARFTAQHLRNALIQVRKAQDAIEELEPAMFRSLSRGSKRAGALATQNISDELAAFSLLFAGVLYPLPIANAAQLAVGDKMLIPRFASSARRYSAEVLRDIRRQLSIGLVSGETFFQLTSRLAKLGGPRGRVPMRITRDGIIAEAEMISEGLFRRYRHWADRIVRTEVLNSYNVQADGIIRDLAKNDPELQRRWDATIDRRTCRVCRDLDGETVGIGEPFPGGYKHPPAHPNCRCGLTVWREGWSER